jgi:hypothetical protein
VTSRWRTGVGSGERGGRQRADGGGGGVVEEWR